MAAMPWAKLKSLKQVRQFFCGEFGQIWILQKLLDQFLCLDRLVCLDEQCGRTHRNDPQKPRAIAGQALKSFRFCSRGLKKMMHCLLVLPTDQGLLSLPGEDLAAPMG